MKFKKADAQIRIIIRIGNILKIENLSLKKANADADFNQADKRAIDAYTWTLKDINTIMNFFGGGDIVVSPRGSFYIGRITAQRKGGTPDPTKLQFKIKPCDL